ncbi:hypothetical protein [Trujillonella humicola]|uniref:hypothetical protein n=1 Tax=Trujillonella humicola TaxID=3383699 RepID=UPI003905DE54
MSSRGPLVRCLAFLGLVVVGGLALIGGLALRPAGLLAVGLGAVVAGALAAGIAREASDDDLRTTIDATWQTAGWTVLGLLVLSGVAAVAGALITTLVGAVGGMLGLAVWMARTRPSRRSPAAPPASPPAAAPPFPPAGARPVPPAGARPVPAPVSRPTVVTGNVAGGPLAAAPLSALPLEVLGHEWTSTSAALAAGPDPRAREAIVGRREQVLDELERRDPAGFARWLAAGPLSATDPARYLRAGAAGTDV